MDGGAWKAAVHGVAEGRTRLSDFTFTFHFSCIGEENGNLLQCSYLENPRDRGAWWAAIYGIIQSQIRLSDFTFTFMHWRRKWQPTPVFLPGESRDGGAWWAAVYGVAQSRTRLKWLISSNLVILFYFLISIYLRIYLWTERVWCSGKCMIWRFEYLSDYEAFGDVT